MVQINFTEFCTQSFLHLAYLLIIKTAFLSKAIW